MEKWQEPAGYGTEQEYWGIDKQITFKRPRFASSKWYARCLATVQQHKHLYKNGCIFGVLQKYY